MMYWLLKIVAILILSWTPIPRITVYQLTPGQCDNGWSTRYDRPSWEIGAFGPMGKYPQECALTRKAARELHADPGDLLFVWTGDWEHSGFWHYHDHMPGKRAKIDLQIDGNWSGKGFAVNLHLFE